MGKKDIVEKFGDKNKGYYSGKQKLNIENFDADKITIIPFGDNHVGSKYHDEDLFKNHLEYVMETPDTYALFMGDNIDAGTRDSVGASVYEQTEIIDLQMERWKDLVRPLVKKGKVLGTHCGNHEDRVFKQCGVDITRLMANDLGIKYLGWTVHHLFRVGGQSYTLMSMHGSGGSRLPHTKIKAVIDRSNMSDVEVYLMGHLHQLSHHTRNFYRVNKQRKTVEEGEKHFVLCGSYLTHWGSYAESAGYEMMRKGSPKIKLSGLEHRIKVSL